MSPVLTRTALALLIAALLAFAPPARADFFTPAAAEVVGTGTAASCTEAALRSAVDGGGDITFNCGPDPVTIRITQPLDITAPSTTIDGGGRVTLSGGGQNRIITHRTFGNIGSSTLTLRNLTLAEGRASGASDAANGAAVQSVFQAANPAFKPTLNLEGVTVRNNDVQLTTFSGDAYDFGGAIYTRGGAVNVTGSTFTGNDSNNAAGGAIHVLQSALSVTNSTFDQNSAIGAEPRNSQGGAIYIDGAGGPGGQIRIVGSTFTNNTTYNSGGAIYVNLYENSTGLTVERSSFVNNAVVGGSGALGGAISGGGTPLGADSGNPTITISESLFAGNSARRSGSPADGSGGALAFAQRARITITNSTFQGNRAEGSQFNANGGALYVVNNTDRFIITNSTFAGNVAGWVGGAISNARIGGQPGGALRNTLFSQNSADNGPNDWNIQQHCSSELADEGGNLQFPPRLTGGNFGNDVTCFQGKSRPDQTGDPLFRDPKLQPLADNGGPTQTMSLAADSPALDLGAANCPQADQRGVARANPCDSGALELVSGIASISPAVVGLDQLAAGPITIEVSGAGFTASSRVTLNGAERQTTFVDSTRLRFTIAAADVSAGTHQVGLAESSLPPRTLTVVTRLTVVSLPLVRR